jgi:hypothetical protein
MPMLEIRYTSKLLADAAYDPEKLIIKSRMTGGEPEQIY